MSRKEYEMNGCVLFVYLTLLAVKHIIIGEQRDDSCLEGCWNAIKEDAEWRFDTT